jgi:hypothetical protein
MARQRWRLTSPKVIELEKHVTKAVLETLEWKQWAHERLDVLGPIQLKDGSWTTIGYPGRPDYICFHARYPAFYMELKRPGGKVSPEQKRVHWELGLSHFEVAVINSVEAILAWLTDWEQKHSYVI